jgi:hypothetical protein
MRLALAAALLLVALTACGGGQSVEDRGWGYTSVCDYFADLTELSDAELNELRFHPNVRALLTGSGRDIIRANELEWVPTPTPCPLP